MHDPIARFSEWYLEASQCPDIADASAMTLATATREGMPAARIVLLKEHGPHGFVFYGNMESRKFRELEQNPQAALCFYWAPLQRQVRIEGPVVRVSDAAADAYFASRPRMRQIGAWSSDQSRPLPSREELEKRAQSYEARFAGKDVPRPPHWSGWQLTPQRMEFWVNSNARLHEREIYTRANEAFAWQYGLLFP